MASSLGGIFVVRQNGKPIGFTKKVPGQSEALLQKSTRFPLSDFAYPRFLTFEAHLGWSA